MALNLQTDQTKILYLPLGDEQLPNLRAHTTLKQSEHNKLSDVKSATFDVCTGITKEAYSRKLLNEIMRTLKDGGILMIQIAKERDLKNDLQSIGFIEIESTQKHQIRHWTARKPKNAILRVDEEIITQYKTSRTLMDRFFVSLQSKIKFDGLTLVIPCVGVGNIGQISMNILLISLLSKGEIVKIGYVNDRNQSSAVSNVNGLLTMNVEVWVCKKGKFVLILQRSALRIGGRGEYIQNLLGFAQDYGFGDIVLLTSEYLTKRTEFETKQNVKMVYYKSDTFNMHTLGWKKSLSPIGHGIANKVFLECVKSKKSVIVLCAYSEDSDNTEQSLCFLDNFCKLLDAMNDKKSDFKLTHIKKWKLPRSLAYAHGGKLPNGIY